MMKYFFAVLFYWTEFKLGEPDKLPAMCNFFDWAFSLTIKVLRDYCWPLNASQGSAGSYEPRLRQWIQYNTICHCINSIFFPLIDFREL